MITLIEILDSAVKIGLGAAIAGLTSFIVAWKNHRHETLCAELTDRKQIVIDLATTLERLEFQYNDSVYHYFHNDQSAALKTLVPATKDVYSARAYANLLDSDDLVEKLEELAKVIENVFEELYQVNPNVERFNDLGIELSKIKKSAYPFIRKAYINGL